MGALARLERKVDVAVLYCIMGPVSMRMVHDFVHIQAEEVIGFLIAKQTKRRGIAEGALSVAIDSINRFPC